MARRHKHRHSRGRNRLPTLQVGLLAWALIGAALALTLALGLVALFQ